MTEARNREVVSMWRRFILRSWREMWVGSRSFKKCLGLFLTISGIRNMKSFKSVDVGLQGILLHPSSG